MCSAACGATTARPKVRKRSFLIACRIIAATSGSKYGFDKELRGNAGAKSVLVNNLGYRQTENVWSPAEAGHNVVLTIDLRIQQAAENALRNVRGPATRGAVVVMDVRTGDVLAMASSPTFNPNDFIARDFRTRRWHRMNATSRPKKPRDAGKLCARAPFSKRSSAWRAWKPA